MQDLRELIDDLDEITKSVNLLSRRNDVSCSRPNLSRSPISLNFIADACADEDQLLSKTVGLRLSEISRSLRQSDAQSNLSTGAVHARVVIPSIQYHPNHQEYGATGERKEGGWKRTNLRLGIQEL